MPHGTCVRLPKEWIFRPFRDPDFHRLMDVPSGIQGLCRVAFVIHAQSAQAIVVTFDNPCQGLTRLIAGAFQLQHHTAELDINICRSY